MVQVTIATGADVDYYLDQMGYYLEAGEPDGRWCGRGAAGLGLSGAVDKEQVRALYHHHVGPDGQVLGRRQKSPEYEAKRSWKAVEEAIQVRIDDLGSLATPEEIRQIRLSERSKNRTATPYYDMTASGEKSLSVAYAAARAAAVRATEALAALRAKQDGANSGGQSEQDEAEIGRLEAEEKRNMVRAARVEAAVDKAADAMLRYVENNGAVVRTGHHSKHSGEWRDAAGLVGIKFLQHTSRKGDPQLHCQVPILNLAQRADGADEKWRALDGRQIFQLRLGAAAHAGMAEAQELARMGVPLVKREDGNGYEIGGVTQKLIGRFSRRSKDIQKQLAERIRQYEADHPGCRLSRAALYQLRQEVTIETRAAKSKPRPNSEPSRSERSRDGAGPGAKEVAEWVRQAEADQAQALADLWDDIAAYAAERPEATPSEMPSTAEREEIVRSAIAEVQRANSSWSRSQLLWELYRQMPVLPAAADWEAYLEELADDAIENRIDDGAVIQIGHIPDLVDVAPLGLRKDGTSVYRKPNEQRYVTSSHMDLEEWVLEAAGGETAQLVTPDEAADALAGRGLDHDQLRAAEGMLTSARLVSSLVAPAGTGKTYTIAQFARAHIALTGCRVIGLSLSENAARVMAGEGLAEAYNIARFFTAGVQVHRGDVLVVDEASQVSTVDLGRILSLAERQGARVVLTGDTEQLSAVEAGGMFNVIEDRYGSFKLAEVRRFAEGWERDASVRMRSGDMQAWAEYAARGRVHEGPQDRVRDQAVDRYLTDTGRGKNVLLLAGTNEEAAGLARMVRDRRIEGGQIPAASELVLADGNDAGTGDLVRARHNVRIDADGRRLTNRDVLRIDGWTGTGNAREAVVVRQLPDDEGGGWSGQFTVPVAYLREHSELAYAGNIYTAQGRTVDLAHLVVTEGMSRDMLYVAMTRGRGGNYAWVVTGPADPGDWSREQRAEWAREASAEALRLAQAGDLDASAARVQMPEPEGTMDRTPWEAVIAAAMEREDGAQTAIETMRDAQEAPVHSRHLLDLVRGAWWQDVVPQIDEMIRRRVPEHAYRRYLTDPERPALLELLREHEIGGAAIPDLLDRITARDLSGLNSIAAGLHGRLGKEEAPVRGQTRTWGERVPAAWTEGTRQAGERRSQLIQEGCEALDARRAELGERAAERPEHWALHAWGVPPEEPGALRDAWIRNAGQVQQYRELAGITNPNVALGAAPVREAELSEAFAAAVRALALPDEDALLQAQGRGTLEATVRAAERAQAAAPADVSAELDRNSGAIAHWADQARSYREAGDDRMHSGAQGVVAALEEKRGELRIADAARREWAEAHAPQVEQAKRARAELRHRKPAREAAGQEAERISPETAREAEADIDTAAAEAAAGAEANRIRSAREAAQEALRVVKAREAELEIQAEEDRRRQLHREPEAEAAYEYHRHAYRPPEPDLGRGPTL